MVLIFVAPVQGWTGTGVLHPQDGPHVDVRIRILPEQVLIRLEMNLVFLDEMVDFQREQPQRIASNEFEELPEILGAFFRENHPILIDGLRVLPTLERLQINDPDLALLPLFPVSGEMGLRKIKFDLVYPVKQPPTRVEIEWGTYPPDILTDPENPPKLIIAAEIDAEGTRRPLVFSADEPGFTWHALGDSIEARMLKVPSPPEDEGVEVSLAALIAMFVGSAILVAGLVVARRTEQAGPLVVAIFLAGLLLALAALFYTTNYGAITVGGGPGLPTRVQAEEIFRPLHGNIYRAFDYVEETDIYDALAQSAYGDFLDTIYRTIFASLVMEEEGGAVARVARVIPSEIDVEEIGLSPDGLPAFTVRCRWRVDGVVSHWGHAHARSNEYVARWSVQQTPAGWRLTGTEILQQDRIENPGWETQEEEFEL